MIRVFRTSPLQIEIIPMRRRRKAKHEQINEYGDEARCTHTCREVQQSYRSAERCQNDSESYQNTQVAWKPEGARWHVRSTNSNVWQHCILCLYWLLFIHPTMLVWLWYFSNPKHTSFSNFVVWARSRLSLTCLAEPNQNPARPAVVAFREPTLPQVDI